MQGFANLLLLSGPSGGGKSTFAHLLREGTLPIDIQGKLSPGTDRWPLIDVTNRMRRKIETEGEAAVAGEIGNPSELILHYDITTVYRYGLAGYEADPALRMLRLARNIQVVFVCPDAGRLYTQFVNRDVVRKARKSSFARAWNTAVLAPARRLRLRLSGQALNSERALYSDPTWLAQCYSAWEAYITALKTIGAAQGVLRVEPYRGDAAERVFRIVPQPHGPATAIGDGDLG